MVRMHPNRKAAKTDTPVNAAICRRRSFWCHVMSTEITHFGARDASIRLIYG